MHTIHQTTIVSKCPFGAADVYEAEFDVGDVFMSVESIQEAIDRYTTQPIFQERLAQFLANALRCKVTLRGTHGKFRTTCTAEEKTHATTGQRFDGDDAETGTTLPGSPGTPTDTSEREQGERPPVDGVTLGL